jgi:hypothetical protein
MMRMKRERREFEGGFQGLNKHKANSSLGVDESTGIARRGIQGELNRKPRQKSMASNYRRQRRVSHTHLRRVGVSSPPTHLTHLAAHHRLHSSLYVVQ